VIDGSQGKTAAVPVDLDAYRRKRAAEGERE
jgi:hypothetical protein